MARKAVDYSWGRPSLLCLKSNGIEGAARYLSRDRTGKNLTAAEAQTLLSHGLWVLLNWEGTGNWSEFRGGYTAGASEGAHCAQLLREMGVPANIEVFISVDYGAPQSHWVTIEAFFKGFAAAVNRPVSFYGQGNLGDWLLARGTIRHIWQTNAHGWGGVSAKAVLYQHLWTKLCGVDVDPNTVTGDPRTFTWHPAPLASEDDMTPQDRAQQAEILAESKSAALSAAGTFRLAQIAASWQARDGVTAGIVKIYKTRLGRDPRGDEIDAWRGATTVNSFDEIDRFVAGTDEGVRYAASRPK